MATYESERQKALKYIVDTQYGYVRDLIKSIGDVFTKEFISLGFVIMGYTWENKTWKVSELAKEYYQVVS